MKVSSVLLCATAASAAASSPNDAKVKACAQQDNFGCSAFCGFEGILAGKEYVCMPSAIERPSFPFTITKEDRKEYCDMVAIGHGCDDICGFKWDEVAGECRSLDAVPAEPTKKLSDDPIIGGQGKFRYQYMPQLLQPPAGASLVNCHGLVTDNQNNIYLTYQNDGKDQNCLIRWNPDGTGGVFMTGENSTLCSGTPHGLKITTEGPTRQQFLYHANNDQKLTKTTLDGTIVWQVNGLFGQPTTDYRPTWFATPPDSDYMYVLRTHARSHARACRWCACACACVLASMCAGSTHLAVFALSSVSLPRAPAWFDSINYSTTFVLESFRSAGASPSTSSSTAHFQHQR
jgi:hypothetical protein